MNNSFASNPPASRSVAERVQQQRVVAAERKGRAGTAPPDNPFTTSRRSCQPYFAGDPIPPYRTSRAPIRNTMVQFRTKLRYISENSPNLTDF